MLKHYFIFSSFVLLMHAGLSQTTPKDTVPVMPDYESKLSKSELDQLAAYLSTTGEVKK